MCGGKRRALFLVPLLFASARGQCYLEDAAAECAVCWTTNSAGVTKGGKCPTGAVEVTWTQAPPAQMTAGLGYHTEYAFKIDRTVFPVILKQARGQDVMVPHSNIHSCVRSRGACTPFVGNTPGLATHTAALIGNLSTVDGQYLLDTFSTEMQLATGSYTVIAHTRFFVPDSGQDATQSCYPNCLTKVDTAVGILREVVEAEVSTSTDAYVATGVLGGCMLLTGLSVLWGVRSGKLDLGSILEALTRDEIVLVVDMVIGLGDVVAYTIGFVEEVLVDPNLVNIIPAAILFLCTGWLASITAAIQNLFQLRTVMQKHYHTDKYMEAQGETLVRQISCQSGSSGRSSKSRQSGKQGAEEELDKEAQDESSLRQQTSLRKLKTTKVGQDMIADAERNAGRMWNLYMNAVTLIFSDIPLTAIGVFIVLKADGIEVAVVAALCASTLMVGAKAHGLTSFAEQRKKARLAKEKISKFMSEEDGEGGEGGGKCLFDDGFAKDAEAGIEFVDLEQEVTIAQMHKRPQKGAVVAVSHVRSGETASKWRAAIHPAAEPKQAQTA